MRKYNVAIVGATGLVGNTFIKVLEEYKFPVKSMKLLASAKSAGKQLKFNDELITVEELMESSFDGIDIAFFSAGGEVARIYGPIAASKGVRVIDNSSAFRADENIGLVIPEVNFDDYKLNNIIANPNCSTIQVVIPLKAIQDAYGIKRIVYSTYQAVSGSGQKGINDLSNSLEGKPCVFYPHDISKTCIPEIDSFLESGYTKEEMKMVNETKKILHNNDAKISATCIRVPVSNGHGVSVMLETNKQFDIEHVKKVLSNYENVIVVDDGVNHKYPTSVLAENTDYVYVGRIRRDLSCDNGLLFYCVADNVRRGAASNAVLTALKLVEKDVL